MSNQLAISDELALPFEAVTQTFAILAKRGVGKTYTAAVLAEEMLSANQPVVIVDPIGVWWGLRSSADGRQPGYPVVILGGDHGDIDIEPSSGTQIADLVISERLQAVIDIGRFRKGEQTRFMIDFAERLYHKNRDPLHVILDEADAFAPQRPMRDQARMLGAIEDIVRRGRARGLGITLITQRAAVLNKNVLTQIEALVALRTIAPQDRAAIDAWVQVHGEPEQRDQMMESLPSLPIGTAWFWSPGWLDIFQRVKVRKRTTFDSSATPKVGKKIKPPSTLADVDLVAVQKLMEDTIERAKQEDPKELRKQLNAVTRERDILANKLKKAEAAAERPVTPAAATTAGNPEAERALLKIARIVKAYQPGTSKPATKKVSVPTSKEVSPTDFDSPLPKAHRLILRAFYWLKDETANKTKIAFYSGYSAGSGSFSNVISNLRTRGLVEDWHITDAGISSIPDEVAPKPTGMDLREWLRPKLAKSENVILDVLIEAYPERLGKEEIALRSGYSAGSGSFSNSISRLRTLVAAEGFDRDGGTAASEVFFS